MQPCTKCNGSMIVIEMIGLRDPYLALRCVNCGELLDRVIAKNRQLQLAQLHHRPKKNGGGNKTTYAPGKSQLLTKPAFWKEY